MKREVAKGFTKLGLLVIMIMIAAGTSAKAQSLEYALTANIPFDFTVADKKFPAGEYSVGRAQQTAGDTILQIRRVDGHANINRFTIPVIRLTSVNKATLVFHRYGDEYFLFQVWPAGATTGRALPKSRSERDVVSKAHDYVGMVMMKVTIVADR